MKNSDQQMRDIIVIAIMVHECPFSIVKDDIWVWTFKYANPEFKRISCKIAISDYLTLYEVEKKIRGFIEKCKQDQHHNRYMEIMSLSS